MDDVRQTIARANQQVVALHQAGQTAEGAELALQAYLLARDALPVTDILRRSTTMNAAAVSEVAGDPETALFLYNDAVALAEEADDKAFLGQALDRLFAIHYARGEVDDAVRFGTRSLELWRSYHLPMNDIVLTFMNNLAEMHYKSGNVEVAAEMIEEVVQQRRALFGEETPELALALANLATARLQQGDRVVAESHMLRALAIRRRVFPPDHQAIFDALHQLVGLYQSNRQYRRAVPYEEEALDIEKRRGGDGRDLARALNNLATLYYRLDEVARSRPLYEESLEIIRKIHGDHHEETAIAKGNLANVLRQLGEFEGAERLLRDVIAVRRSLLGEQDPDVATAIDDLTDLFRDSTSAKGLEDSFRDLFDSMLRYFDRDGTVSFELLVSLRKIERDHALIAPDRPRSLPTIEMERRRTNHSLRPLVLAEFLFQLREFGLALTVFEETRAGSAEGSLEWSRAMNGLAASLAQLGELQRVVAVTDEYIARAEGGWNAPARDYSSLLRAKADVLNVTSGPAAAVEAMLLSVEQAREAYGDDPVRYAQSLVHLAELQFAAGDSEAAAKVAHRVLETRPAQGQVMVVAGARAVLARIARSEGRIVEAESHYRAALDPMTAWQPNEWRTAELLRDFGVMYAENSQAEQGLPLIERAAAIAEKLFGTRSIQHALMLTWVAEAKETAGALHEAVDLYADIARTAEELDAPELLARVYIDTGHAYARIGASDAAAWALNHAIEVLTRSGGSALSIARAQISLARAEAQRKQPETALALIDAAIAAFQAAGASAHLSNAVWVKMWILGRMQRWEEAYATARQSSQSLEQSLRRHMAIASSAKREELVSSLYGQLDVLLSIAVRLRDPGVIEHALERTLRWKGYALTWSASEVLALAEVTAVDVVLLRDDLSNVRRQIITRQVSGTDETSLMEELRRREEALDGEIARLLTDAGRAETPPAVMAAVAAALPPDAALIEYVRYESIDFERGAGGDQLHPGHHRYAAFVLRAGAGPVLVDVGDADAIDREIGRFRAWIIGESDAGGFVPRPTWTEEGVPPQSEHEELDYEGWLGIGTELRRTILDPLGDAIGSCTRLHIAQHGDLTRLPFAALPAGDEVLLDRYELAFLDTGRDLLRSRRAGVSAGAPLVVADPDFDLGLDGVAPEARVTHFPLMPETREEGEAIASILGVTPVTGAAAIELRVHGARSPRILHLATHGFFLADDRPPMPSNVADTVFMVDVPGFGQYLTQVTEKTRPVDDGPPVDRVTRLGRLRDPLLRSGLALAGSNTWASFGALPDGAGDGLLTAAEIALLDLTSTDLAVLSACETGLGELRRGEGVYGLRRAFAIAGAGTLVMSLWKVPDAQTKDLMIELYMRLDAGESCSEALRAAQLALRVTAPDPLMWAGFVCIGISSPLPARRPPPPD